MRRLFAYVLLAATTAAIAQEGFPLDGTWRGERSAPAGSPSTLVMVMEWDGKQIKGDLLVKNKVAVSRNLSLRTMGGNLTLSGIVDSSNPRAIDVVCTSRLNEINMDSVFYVFEKPFYIRHPNNNVSDPLISLVSSFAIVANPGTYRW